jgi:hypothetical protein
MEISRKLQIPAGVPVFLVNPPVGFYRDLPVTSMEEGAAVMVFAEDSMKLKKDADPAIRAAKADRLSWIAYPKAGQLKTDLNRDRLQELMAPYGVEGVRLVSIDDVWSAMRFRPTGRQSGES